MRCFHAHRPSLRQEFFSRLHIHTCIAFERLHSFRMHRTCMKTMATVVCMMMTTSTTMMIWLNSSFRIWRNYIQTNAHNGRSEVSEFWVREIHRKYTFRFNAVVVFFLHTFIVIQRFLLPAFFFPPVHFFLSLCHRSLFLFVLLCVGCVRRRQDWERSVSCRYTLKCSWPDAPCTASNKFWDEGTTATAAPVRQ